MPHFEGPRLGKIPDLHKGSMKRDLARKLRAGNRFGRPAEGVRPLEKSTSETKSAPCLPFDFVVMPSIDGPPIHSSGRRPNPAA
jgi:hypothetical protein